MLSKGRRTYLCERVKPGWWCYITKQKSVENSLKRRIDLVGWEESSFWRNPLWSCESIKGSWPRGSVGRRQISAVSPLSCVLMMSKLPYMSERAQHLFKMATSIKLHPSITSMAKNWLVYFTSFISTVIKGWAWRLLWCQLVLPWFTYSKIFDYRSCVLIYRVSP